MSHPPGLVTSCAKLIQSYEAESSMFINIPVKNKNEWTSMDFLLVGGLTVNCNHELIHPFIEYIPCAS